jgi:hypothetical protein
VRAIAGAVVCADKLLSVPLVESPKDGIHVLKTGGEGSRLKDERNAKRKRREIREDAG